MPATPSSTIVLAGDIGGTNARFALAREDAGRIVLDPPAVLPVAAHATFAAALAAFLASCNVMPARACFAVAGPAHGGRAQLTNAPWSVDAQALAAASGIAAIDLVNDFQAAATGIDDLAAASLVPLQAGTARPGAPRLVIGAGTGLGVAVSLPDAGGARVLAGEGGHVGFAPADDEQVALWRFLVGDLGRVAAEHLLSGSGIVRLYAFARDRAGAPGPWPADVEQDGAAAVVHRADAGDATAAHALDLFAAIFGAVAGDHALAAMATGGVYLAGGIAPRLAQRLAAGRFLASFRAKGVHAQLMTTMPVWIVRDQRLGLLGAARFAFAQGRGGGPGARLSAVNGAGRAPG